MERMNINTTEQSLQNILMHACQIESRCRDYTVNSVARQMRVRDDNNFIDYLTSEGFMSSQMSPWAQKMLCSKIGVPNAYIQKLQEEKAFGLAAENLNFWLRNSGNTDMFIRTYDEQIRAFTSTRYSPFDSGRIMDVLCDTINEDEWSVKGSFVNEERLHIRMINWELLDPDDDLYFALFIDSSDVCKSNLVIRIGIFKQVCTNGLMISRAGGTLFRQRHYSISKEEFEFGVISALRQVPQLYDRVREYVHLAKAKTLTFTNLDDIIESVKFTADVSQETAKKIVNLLPYYGHNRWGLINSITETAQEFSVDERIRLEEIAGNLLVAA